MRGRTIIFLNSEVFLQHKVWTFHVKNPCLQIVAMETPSPLTTDVFYLNSLIKISCARKVKECTVMQQFF